MKISNNNVVNTANEPNGGEAPCVQYGNLNPCRDYADSKLYEQKPGSIYIQQIYTEINCRRQYTGTCMWFKVRHSGGDLCGGTRGKSNDWAKMATGSFTCGTEKPSGAPEFCCLPLMSWYAQIVEEPNQACACKTQLCACGSNKPKKQGIHLYFKVQENCALEDWLLVYPSIEVPNILDHKPYGDGGDSHEEEWLNCLPVGSRVYHIDCDTGMVVAVYLKLSNNNGNVSDWVNLNAGECYNGTVDPNTIEDGNLAMQLECANVGAAYWQTSEEGTETDEEGNETPVICKYLWLKSCDGEWCMPAPKIELINRPDLSCKPELVCGVLNLPTTFVWRRSDGETNDAQLVPRNILTPLVNDVTMADTPGLGGHGDGLCIACDGLWNVEATVVIRHPLDQDEPGPPWSEDALFGLFVGNGQGQVNPGFIRQYTQSFSQDGLYYATIYVQREIPIKEGACYYNYLFWEDVSDEELGMVEVSQTTLKATLIGCMPDDYDGPWAT